jgi:hypothetical protein
MDSANDSEEREEGDVGTKVGSVLIDAPLDRASVKLAGSVGAEGDDTLRKLARHVDR